MKRSPVGRFILRWFISSLGIWIAAGLLSQRISYDSRLSVIIIAGFLLAVINSLIKPIVVILSLPAILFSLGLFMIVINGFMVLLVSYIYKELQISNFGTAMVAGMVIGLVNYLVTTILEEK
jgi:putative membrane protein